MAADDQLWESRGLKGNKWAGGVKKGDFRGSKTPIKTLVLNGSNRHFLGFIYSYMAALGKISVNL